MHSRRKNILTFVGLLVLIANNSDGQGTFRNLDFEDATFYAPNLNSGYVEVNDAMPGWVVSYGSSPQAYMFYNIIAAGQSSVAITSDDPNTIYTGRIEGGISAFLQGGDSISGSPASISQIGEVPVTSHSIRFKARAVQFNANPGAFLVSLGGQDIPFYALETGQNYTVYGGDVTAFAGQTAELKFSAGYSSTGLIGSGWMLDGIQFSSNPIPEPSALGLASLSLLFLWRRITGCWKGNFPLKPAPHLF